jgi:hypothetical protein
MKNVANIHETASKFENLIDFLNLLPSEIENTFQS